MARRDWVIGRMLEDGAIDEFQAQQAWAEPLTVVQHGGALIAQADYFAEEVRRELVKLYGEDKLYQGGLSVRTTLDPRLQVIADTVLRDGLMAYDQRHGWRGPIRRVDLAAGDWHELLAPLQPPPGAGAWRLALVLEVGEEGGQIGLKDDSVGQIPFAELSWARPWKKDQKVGPAGAENLLALDAGSPSGASCFESSSKPVESVEFQDAVSDEVELNDVDWSALTTAAPMASMYQPGATNVPVDDENL